MEQERLHSMIHTCAQQARWHYEQYTRLQQCQQYFVYLLHHNSHLHGNSWEEHLQNMMSWQTTERKHSAGVSMDQQDIDQGSSTTCEVQLEKKRRKKKKRRKSKQEPSLVKGESESDIALDDGFKEFLKESARFRAERDAKKNTSTMETNTDQKNDDVVIEYVDILRKGPEGTKLPPTAQNRKELYEEKYGTKGTAILSLETALQWKFNKSKDSRSHVLWPAIPIRMIYE